MKGQRVYIVYTQDEDEVPNKVVIQGIYMDRHDALKQVQAINESNMLTGMTAFWSAQEVR